MVQPGAVNNDHLPFLVVVLISADAEWSAVKRHHLNTPVFQSPFGEWFELVLPIRTSETGGSGQEAPRSFPVIFFQGGWGKIAAAASTQYVIDTWKPHLMVNLGTCGGFRGLTERFDIYLVNETVVYDIYEQMGDPATHIAHYASKIDLSWLVQSAPPPLPVRYSLLVSGDRDLLPGEICELNKRYGATAGDWESGAIAYIATRNAQRLVIIRGVTDLVGDQDGEAYQNIGLFINNTGIVMDQLLEKFLPWVLNCFLASIYGKVNRAS
jgi:adenosylhomocysteine nucleosidase